jgi:hypothetical protein
VKRFLISCLLLLCPLANGRSDLLGQSITLTPPADWESVRPFPASLAESPYPTLKYLPKDGRPVEIIITLLPADVVGFPVTDPVSLRKVCLIAAEPYLDPAAPLPACVELALPEGLGVRITAPCPPAPGRVAGREHTQATIANLLVGSRYLVHVAIFHDGDEAPEYGQALQTLFSMRCVVSGPVACTPP